MGSELDHLQQELEHEKERLKEAGAEALRWIQEDLAPSELAEKHPWVLAALSAGVAALIAGGIGYWSGKNSRD
jgi:hypothetical protein